MNQNIDLDDDSLVANIEKYAENYLKENISSYLYKTSKELHADIDSFGLYTLKYFNYLSDWEDYNWLHHYQDAFFDVNVDVDLNSSYLLVNTSKEKDA